MDWFNKHFKSVKPFSNLHYSFLSINNQNKKIFSIKAFVNLLFILIILNLTSELNAEGDKYQKGRSLKKNNGTPYRTHFNINNISTWIYNNGDSDISPTGNSGFEYPKGSGKTAVFESGLLWGAKLNGEVRVGGSHYNQGLLPGRIDENGFREDTSLEHVRIYRIRPDWKLGDLTAEIIDEEGTEQEIRDQYEKDWNEWPAIYGAPFQDIDKNGIYDPVVDIPGVNDADQTIWYVANDLDPATSKSLYGSDPMGLELQVTIWGYYTNNSSRALDNTLFKKYKFINKSINDFDSMYVAMWADPDLGGAGDDYVGCDVDLSLMYCYNGDSDDNEYGSTVPAVGFDLVQGPIVIGNSDDEAIYDGKIKIGYKNLPMTSHYFTICGGADYRCPWLGDYENGTLAVWNIVRGFFPFTGEPFISPTTSQITKFTLDGDPILRTGWLDGWLRPPGDRTQTMSSGPFTLAVGDTQEVVYAELIGGGTDNIDRIEAIAILKNYDTQIQGIYSNLFMLPPSLKAPDVTVSSLDKQIILSWFDNEEIVNEIETYDTLNYTFQGYVVYQFPNANSIISAAIPIATFDLIDGLLKVIESRFDAKEGIFVDKVKFRGVDEGIERSFLIEKDSLNSNRSLYNGSEYYFTVSAYAVSSDPYVRPLYVESPIRVIEAIPHTPNPGGMLTSNRGDTLSVDHVTGGSEGITKIIIVDPTLVNGKTYTMFFHKNTDSNSTTSNNMLWGLKDDLDQIVSDNHSFYIRDRIGLSKPPIVDGLEITVASPNPGILDWSYEGNRWISAVNWGGDFFFGGMDIGFNFLGSKLTEGTDFYNVQLQFAGDAKFSEAIDKSATAIAATSQSDQPEFWSKGQSYRRDLGYRASGIADIPFAVYDMESNPPRRLNICIVEDANDGVANLLWDMGWGGSAFATLGGREYILIMDSDYNEGIDYDDSNWGSSADVLYAIWPQTRGSRSYLSATYTLDIIASDPHTEEDIFVFTAPESGYNNKKAKEDVKKINVFPNPYYGTNLGEFGRSEHYITFNHLPNKAIIRIYNLAGHRIKKITKNDESQFLKWDLNNEDGFSVASGLYVVYVDMPDLGETKILKIAIMQEADTFDSF